MRLFITFCILVFGVASGELKWDRLPDVPDREGFAGAFSGVLSEGGEDFLVLAGGANFPDGRPWEDGKKFYYDGIYILPLKKGGEWRTAAIKLPIKVGYGMSVSLKTGRCLFMGGKNEAGSRPEVLELSMALGKVKISRIGNLPRAIAEGVAAVVDGEILVGSGGDGEETHREIFKLMRPNLTTVRWESLGWPKDARGRMYPVAGVKGGKFYLFGGRDFAESEEKKENRIFGLDFLNDCWELDPLSGTWKRLSDLPEARSAAPSMAVPMGASSLLMLGGVSVEFLRKQVVARPEINGQGMEHPGFPASILSYNTVKDQWAEAGSLPLAGTFAPVTTPVVFWDNKVIIPTGEIKPGVRSPQVLIVEMEERK
jgi:N-acetylneuraminic acid mutarotase